MDAEQRAKVGNSMVGEQPPCQHRIPQNGEGVKGDTANALAGGRREMIHQPERRGVILDPVFFTLGGAQ